jgi:hypothetical protein
LGFVTKLDNLLIVIDILIGNLAEGLDASSNTASVAFVRTIEKHSSLNIIADCTTGAAKPLDMGSVGIKIKIHRISLELRFSVVSKV